MEEVLNAIGALSLVLLVVIGLVAGWIAGKVAGRNRALYLVLGVMAAVATPFVLAALGLGVLAAGGILVILIVAAVGALVVLAIARALLK